jgi:hypothetical protein
VQPEPDHGGAAADRQRCACGQACDLGGQQGHADPPTALLIAAITLAPVNSIPTGRARSPTVAIAAVCRSSSAAWPKNWSASGVKVR